MKKSKDQCWCSVRECPLHNLKASMEEESRIISSTTEKDYCTRGDLGLFCSVRKIDAETRAEIDSITD